jgi:serine/tyrosine/threonine adenylyltransferase
VLNSDNINVTGESFDYGPWRFTPFWDPEFVAAYFDHYGLYAFARQPQAIHWDVVQLTIALSKLVDVEALAVVLDTFPAVYEQAYVRAMLARLGVRPLGDKHDLPVMQAIEEGLGTRTVAVDRFFFDWSGGRLRPGPHDASYAEHFAPLAPRLAPYTPTHATDHPYWSDAEPCSMHIEEVEAIWSAIDQRDDWQPLHDKIAAIRRMGDAHQWPS